MPWKILTYNIHHGQGTDGRVALPRIAAVINGEQPDLAALQEVDRFLPRSRMRHQALVLAGQTGLQYAFAANIRWLGFMQYGNAVLSRHPLLGQRYIPLPGTGEKRGLLIMRIIRGKRTVIFLCTHLGLDRPERKQQLNAIRETIALFTEPVILAGDFNTCLDSGELNILADLLQPAAAGLPTFPAHRPLAGLDNVFHSSHWRVLSVRAIPATASDHLPLTVTLELC